MFTKHKVTAVNSSGIKTTKHGGVLTQASLVPGSSGTTSLNINTYTNSQYSYYMSGLLPATPDIPDSSALSYFYRDMYLHDNVAGSCVDIQSVFPFSDWELRGLEEKELLVFNTALDRLNLRELLPQISVSYLTDGFYAGSLVYDGKAKNFMDILTHDAMSCGVIASPFNNIDPTVRVSVSGAVSQFLSGSTEYAKQYLATMPETFVDLLRKGSFVLDPVTTIFTARRGLTDRAYQSYLHRILPMYLIEKAMYRGTLIEANRRQRAMSHVSVGDDLWTPTSEELAMIVQQFQAAEQDPLGGWITTRNAVQVQDLRPGGDFWKWTDMTDTMVSYKLRALGISEALLSGDACLIGSTQISLSDGSTCSIQDLCPVSGATPSQLPVGQWFDLDLTIPNRVKPDAKTKAWSYQGYRETFEITTEDDRSITATDNHPLWVMDAETGECSWKRVDELKEGDLVAVNDGEDPKI